MSGVNKQRPGCPDGSEVSLVLSAPFSSAGLGPGPVPANMARRVEMLRGQAWTRVCFRSPGHLHPNHTVSSGCCFLGTPGLHPHTSSETLIRTTGNCRPNRRLLRGTGLTGDDGCQLGPPWTNGGSRRPDDDSTRLTDCGESELKLHTQAQRTAARSRALKVQEQRVSEPGKLGCGLQGGLVSCEGAPHGFGG